MKCLIVNYRRIVPVARGGSMSRMLRCLSLALALGAILSPPAFADFPSGIPDRLQLGIGGMQGTFATGERSAHPTAGLA